MYKNSHSRADASKDAMSCEEEASVCDTPGRLLDVSSDHDEPDQGGCRALAWQVGDLPIICDSGASYHMHQSSTGRYAQLSRDIGRSRSHTVLRVSGSKWKETCGFCEGNK